MCHSLGDLEHTEMETMGLILAGIVVKILFVLLTTLCDVRTSAVQSCHQWGQRG